MDELTLAILKLKEIQALQKKNLLNDYMVGMYNGMEVLIALLENRDGIFEDIYRETATSKSLEG